jgi:hypothetical protein
VAAHTNTSGGEPKSGSPASRELRYPPAVAATAASYLQPSVEEIQPATVSQDLRPFRPITQLTTNVALPAGAVPSQEYPAAEAQPPTDDPRLWGGWGGTDFRWLATRLCHRPLYFEQVNVERYGYTISPCLQPAISGAHFFLTIPALPYKATVHPPRECIYTLGHYRPGSRAPRRWHCMEWDPTAATVEGAVATGLVFLIP